MVYLAEIGSMVKVGRTCNVAQRQRRLEYEFGHEVTMLCWAGSTPSRDSGLEAWLHMRLRKWRYEGPLPRFAKLRRSIELYQLPNHVFQWTQRILMKHAHRFVFPEEEPILSSEEFLC